MSARIYTRTGDSGLTGLVDGSRVPKHDLRVAATGTVDETSSVLGLALAQGLGARAAAWLSQVQNDLFDLGADVSLPPAPDPEDGSGEAGEPKALRIDESYVARLEGWIDEVSADVTPLENFVLPGGNAAAAALHLARTVCRRAERALAELMDSAAHPVGPLPLRYLNRLSDLLFVLAREANDGGRADVLWRPGGGRGGDTPG